MKIILVIYIFIIYFTKNSKWIKKLVVRVGDSLIGTKTPENLKGKVKEIYWYKVAQSGGFDALTAISTSFVGPAISEYLEVGTKIFYKQHRSAQVRLYHLQYRPGVGYHKIASRISL